jgi:hypothetical protein
MSSNSSFGCFSGAIVMGSALPLVVARVVHGLLVIVVVLLLQPLFVNVGVRVPLAVVLVFVLVRDVLVLVIGMRVSVRLVAMTVLVGVRMVVLVLHCASLSWSIEDPPAYLAIAAVGRRRRGPVTRKTSANSVAPTSTIVGPDCTSMW